MALSLALGALGGCSLVWRSRLQGFQGSGTIRDTTMLGNPGYAVDFPRFPAKQRFIETFRFKNLPMVAGSDPVLVLNVESAGRRGVELPSLNAAIEVHVTEKAKGSLALVKGRLLDFHLSETRLPGSRTLSQIFLHRTRHGFEPAAGEFKAIEDGEYELDLWWTPLQGLGNEEAYLSIECGGGK
jgi:hypothetical protein